MTRTKVRQGTMVMHGSMKEADARNILFLHFKEQHGIENVEDISGLGYLLPRRLYVRNE